MDDAAKIMHQADNPTVWSKLLDTGLNIAQARLAPSVVPSPVQQVLNTPGNQPSPSVKQLGEEASGFRRYLPHVLIGGAILAVVGLVVWAFKGK
jgi:hypothetical protein